MAEGENKKNDRELEPIPWERGGRGQVLSALVRTASDCLLHPLIFFRRVALDEDRWVALGYAVWMHLVGFGLAGFWQWLWGGEELALSLVRAVLAPLWVFVSVWLGSEMMHGWLRVLRGAHRPRAVTHRTVAYCYTTALLGVIPLYGLRIGLAAAFVYQVIGLREAQQAPLWKAVLAVLLCWLAPLLFLLLLLLSEGSVSDAASP